MSFPILLQVTRYRTFNFNKYTHEKCIRYLRPRLYYNSNDDIYSKKQKLKNQNKRKDIKTRFIQNVQQTREQTKQRVEEIKKNVQQTRQKVEEIIERENIYTIPNFFSIGRILSTPFLGYLIVSQEYEIALWLLGFAGFTDLADGWIARTWTSQASKLGSFLDPVADKLLVGTMFLTLTWVGLIPIPLTCLVVLRDVALIAGASYVRYKSLPPPKTLVRYFDATHATAQLAPTFISKLNTGVQLLLVAGTLAAPVFQFVDHPVLQGLCYLTAFTTIAGGISYLVSKNTYKMLSKNSSVKQPSCKNEN